MKALEFFISELTDPNFNDVSMFGKLTALVEAHPNILNEVNEAITNLSLDDIDRLDAQYR